MKVKDYLVGLSFIALCAFSVVEMVMAIVGNNALAAGIYGVMAGVWFANILLWSVNAVLKKVGA